MAWSSTTLQLNCWICAVITLLFTAAHSARLPLSSGSSVENCSGPVLQHSCKWITASAVKETLSVSGSWPTSSGVLPTVEVSAATDRALTQVPGFSLSLQRLILVNAAVAVAGAADAPKLWPLNMFTAVGTNLTLTDIRVVLAEQDFQAYLSFFKGLPQPPNNLFTDGSSFIQIPEWTDGTTVLRSVTLLGGPCSSQNSAAVFLQPGIQPAVSHLRGSRCNVRTVSNSTLIPTLKLVGSVSTKQLLLVLLASNATLGYGLNPGAIDIERPVMVAGLFGVPTSIDFGMVVNQINATSKEAQVIWQSLYLENISPADGLASTLAPPYSGAVSANLFAIYCNRSSQLCLTVYNTTSVLASTQEMDYLTFMYSMFNSPLPNMRQHTDFYHTELAVKIIDMGPGPDGNGMFLHNMSCSAWEIHDSVFTDKPLLRIAPKLPFPTGRPLVTTSTKAAPWVQGIDDCDGLQAGLSATSDEDRLHVWMLLSNVSINPASDLSCWQVRDVQYTTQVYGQVHGGGLQHSQPVMLPEAVAGQPAPFAAANPVFDMFSLGFNYMRSALQLPSNAGEKYLQIQNVTLLQLPQGPDAATAAGLGAGQSGDGQTPADIWTILLWPINRTWQGSPLFLSDVQLLLPQPEYDFVRRTAETSGSFIVQLAGTVGLAFSGISIVGDTVKIGSLQGPGMTGQNVWLLADTAATSAMPGGYSWPLGVVAAPTSSTFAAAGSSNAGNKAAIAAAIGACVGGLGLLALIGLCVWCCIRHRRQQCQQQQFLIGYKPEGSFQCSSEAGSGLSGPNRHLHQSPGSFVGMDVVQLPDKAADTLLVPCRLAMMQHRQQLSKSCYSGQLPQASLGSSGGITASCSDNSFHMPPAVESVASSNTVASGLQRWKTAISSTTLQLMERRMHLPSTTATVASSSSGGSGQGSSRKSSGAVRSRPGSAMGAAISAKCTTEQAANGVLSTSQPSSLQLQELLGQGSFGCVYLGIWHGKRVAVKVMQLPASALLGPEEAPPVDGITGQQLQRQQAKWLLSNKAPHMAIMETVVSSTMSHPNVVQVYTYMINPLTIEASEPGKVGAGQQQQTREHSSVSGWELRLVMEYCDQGTLREALDRKLLLCDSSSTLLPPCIVLGLAHDVAAAMLHLHSEGVVHGDLKAANVLLTRGGDDPSHVWAATVGHRVTAKVADFGLALPLDPNDTHATMAARGTPTHMSPELFMSGHVSKASDVYAYGILLYEIITGQRAYAGVPVPLLPHEVARQGLRPTWPANLSASLRDLQQLAEACWAQQPQDRPSFQLIFNILDAHQNGRQPPTLPPQAQQQPQQRAGCQPVEGGLDVLDEQSQEHLQLMQHQLKQRFGATGTDKQEVAGGKDMAWSEVTYGGAERE